ncbi:MAG: hypothetical protein IAG13_35635 [Deltaproteobacteria bacterium]|nr:hypothetical protein [Nannocystaceae bacterium]
MGTVGCNSSAAESSSEASEGWSGTPPADPAVLGERCDEWVSCAGDAFCDYGSASGWPSCGEKGICVAFPEACDEIDLPLCGCDGVLYDNACEAAAAGVGTQGAAGCTAPAGRFACGFEFCESGTAFCEHVIGHGQPESWDCRALACTGDLEGCACITDPSPCGDPHYFPGQFCSGVANGGTELTCLPA